MRILGKIVALLLAAMTAVTTQFATLRVHAAEPIEIVDETWTVLKDDYMDSFGWLALSAEPPVGFEGIICLELYSHVTGREVIKLSSMEDYIGGSWLPAGTYTVTDAYVLGSDHFQVECSGTEAVISNSEDATLTLTLQETVDLEATLESIVESFEPSVPTMPSETTGSSVTTEFEQIENDTAPETGLPETLPEPDNEKRSTVIGDMLGFLVILLFLGIILFAWYKKKTDMEE